ncbi:hypothetical protein ColTof4_01417 [Colletotrichum tofieldiae]|nr:hypothetical protein ColTof3_08674 [Colletotrichum tofieldiae]GKT68994.1 hypothetical protein ColTof4_01417 [Colletotrichum tofieldiae]GKT96859.1 hypothetical protein Ct61P_14709 [Colletotrichum tofieldiae]
MTDDGPSRQQRQRLNQCLPTPDGLTDRVCSALFALQRISPNHVEMAPTPLGLLSLDAKPLFNPIESSSHPGTPGYVDVQRAVLGAATQVRDSACPRQVANDEAATHVVEALWHVSHMLLHDESRVYFLSEVQPRLEVGLGRDIATGSPGSLRAKVVQSLCWNTGVYRG